MKPRAEMTPEERAADNKLTKERKKQGNAGMVPLATTFPAQPDHSPQDMPPVNEVFVNDDGFLVNAFGRLLDEGGNRKPRAEMTPEERAADNKCAKERKKTAMPA